MKFYIGSIEIEFSVRRVRYYEIIGYHIKQVIGYCTSEGLEDVKYEEPRAEQDRYIDALYAIIVAPVEVEYGSVKWTESSIRWVMLHATAEQRAEAFLRLKELWRLDE